MHAEEWILRRTALAESEGTFDSKDRLLTVAGLNQRDDLRRAGRRGFALAFWQPSLTCSLDNPLEFLAEGWIVGSS